MLTKKAALRKMRALEQRGHEIKIVYRKTLNAYLYSIDGSPYMSRKHVNTYLRKNSIDPETLTPMAGPLYNVWRKWKGIRVKVIKGNG
jgi:hypothetical protein